MDSFTTLIIGVKWNEVFVGVSGKDYLKSTYQSDSQPIEHWDIFVEQNGLDFTSDPINSYVGIVIATDDFTFALESLDFEDVIKEATEKLQKLGCTTAPQLHVVMD